MNKKLITFFSVMIILVFIGYIIYDTMQPGGQAENQEVNISTESIPDSWLISGDINIKEGSLKAVAVAPGGSIFVGGDSYVSRYEKDLSLSWNIKTPYPVTSLTIYGDTLFASTEELILIISPEGEIKNEWGPFENEGIITSVTSNNSYVAFADAGNEIVFVLDKSGVVKSLIGMSGERFIIPSPYFDIALDSDNTLFIANTGNRRVETRTIDGDLISYFGEPGTAPGAFCGCCNPAHFISIPQGFATAEKGINRIKIINKDGDFVEFVSSNNRFTASIPLDLASSDGKTIYAANPADSKLYIFTRK